jgi:hypothetical protein
VELKIVKIMTIAENAEKRADDHNLTENSDSPEISPTTYFLKNLDNLFSTTPSLFREILKNPNPFLELGRNSRMLSTPHKKIRFEGGRFNFLSKKVPSRNHLRCLEPNYRPSEPQTGSFSLD